MISNNELLTTSKPQLELIKNPIFVYVGHSNYEHKHKVVPHKHDHFSEIIYIVSGEATFTIDGTCYKARDGDLVIINNGLEHEEHYSGQSLVHYYYCGLNNIHVHGLKENCLIPDSISPIVSTGTDRDYIHNLLNQLFIEGYNRRMGYDIICTHLVSVLTICILRMVNKHISHSHENMKLTTSMTLAEKAKKLIDANFTKDFTVESLADNFHVHPSYLAHVFKENIGTPPMRYQMVRRMDEAKRLLSCTSLKVHVIAKMVGFDNTNHFYNQFKKSIGVSPNGYRRSITNSLLSK
ncbi:MAG: AraC family transcriptional regulator [Defluviitaleaceae bacterium]|nr:AraC family transcriptional regulator [Defluviitaleaceae bacterium]